MAAKMPNPIDRHVGSRVRMRRLMLNMSQETLGARLGVSFQQVQKYEKGKSRISASRLHAMSRILQVGVPFFFEDGPQISGHGGTVTEGPTPANVSDFLASADGVKLVRAFGQIADAKLAHYVVQLVEGIAEMLGS